MAKSKRQRYDLLFDESLSDLDIELWMVRRGGSWIGPGGRTYGKGLFFHYRRLQELIWPEEDHHEWSDLILREILNNTFTCILGPKDSGKTHTVARYGLTDYFCFPKETLIIISSTDLRGLELRVWGDLKDLFGRAKELYPELPGGVYEYLHAVSTDVLGTNNPEGVVRDLRKGIVCVPCLSSAGKYTGLGRYVGAKQKRRRLLGDEVQFMDETYMDVPANMNSGDFKGVFIGNPLGSNDTLDRMSEPKGGWNSIQEPKATVVWENRWPNGRTINLVGTDSPNFKVPADQPKKYWYLIGPKEIADIEMFYGKDSLQFYSQGLGIRKTGLLDYRVMTRELCQQFGAFEQPVWKGSPLIRVYGLDAGYTGDRCVGGYCDFGEDINGRTVLAAGMPVVVPIKPVLDSQPEDQIALFVREACSRNGIEPERMFYDSTGRGGLGNAFARAWSAYTNPIEFGGNPTTRAVCADLFILDEKTGQKRLKRCDEQYSKFVTELWFSVRYLIESRQLRGLPQEVAYELAMRQWGWARGNKIELEKKEETKVRMKRSPDLADWLAICVEGARRLGLVIARMDPPADRQAKDEAWREELRRRARVLRGSYTLDYAT